MSNFDYKGVIERAKTYGRSKGLMPSDADYNEFCDWVRTLTDDYRLRMHTYTVVRKLLPENKDHKDLLLEFYHKSKLIKISLVPKSNKCGGK